MILKIKGLDCANCALKIENKLKEDPRLSNVHVDFVKQAISFDMEDDVNLDEIKQKVIDVEDDITFLDNQTAKYTYFLNGLNCADCVSKLEAKLNKQDYIEEARIDFNKAKLHIVYNEDDYSKVKAIVTNFEDGLTIQKDKVIIREHVNYEMLITIIISIILIGLTFIIPMRDNIKLFIYLVAYLTAGYDILIKVVKNLLKKDIFDENFLMGIATIAAFAIGEYLEAIAIMLFFKVGELFQDLAVNRSRKSISSLMDIQADYANVVEKDKLVQKDPSEVKIGDYLIIKPGEKIPLDGVVVQGKTYLDTKALTGESKDFQVESGDEVLSGSINKENLIKIRVTKLFEDSTVAKILDLVENSSANKAPTENFITKFARYYTPTVVFIALAVAIIPPLTFSNDGFYDWIYRALIFLVISCPCALVISIPLGFFGGIGNASKHGILVKGANYLEALNQVESIVLDKTGTLTKGNFKVTKINSVTDLSESELLEIAAYVENYSNHPIALSIKNAFNQTIIEKNISDYQEISGQGIKAKINNDIILAGNALLMKENNVAFKESDTYSTIIYLSKNNEYLGYIEVGDELKEDSISAISKLKDLGIKNIVMLSGDSKNVVENVARKLGIDQYFAKLLPQDKVRIFEELEQNKSDKKKIIFVGDGINDAPVLARADIGIAMGGIGSDAAIESADVIIMNDEISKIATAIKIANKTKRIVVQNIVLALSIKIGVLILGVFGLASIWQAVIADVGVAIIAIFNAMRVLNDKKVGEWFNG